MHYSVKMTRSPSDVVADRVRKYRAQRGWSAQRLAQACAEAGAPELTAAVIANIESGRPAPRTGRRRREVSIDELLALAYALAVPPVLLFVPLGDEDEVALTPTVTVHPHLALQWVQGEEPPVTSQRRATRVREWREVVEPLALYRELRAAQQTAHQTRTQLRRAEYVGDQIERARAAHHESLNKLVTLLARFIEQGVRPPTFGNEWALEAQQAGLTWPAEIPTVENPDCGEG